MNAAADEDFTYIARRVKEINGIAPALVCRECSDCGWGFVEYVGWTVCPTCKNHGERPRPWMPTED